MTALTDWPGHRPNAAETVAVLGEAGAEVNAPFVGEHPETPLHLGRQLRRRRRD